MKSDAAPPARILIVDDDPGIREVISDFLVRHGFEADAVADGPALARALATKRPDLIVLDVMLPGEDGLSVATLGSWRPPEQGDSDAGILRLAA